MKNLKDLRKIYFIGIGGIGMSALARYFKAEGAEVSGYDKTPTALTAELQNEGIAVTFEDEPGQYPKEVDLVVYTPAIPKDHKGFNFYKDGGYELKKRSEVLGLLSANKFTIAVAGSHGKTTVSAMIAHILTHSGFGCSAFLGGIAVNYNSNYIQGSNDVLVIEADEFDRSFHRLAPDMAVITAVDTDHLDIYGSVEEMEAAFIQYTKNIKHNGSLLVKHGLKRASDLHAAHTLTYSLQNDAADSYAANIVQKQGGYVFDVVNKYGLIQDIRLNIGGMHNVENAVAAITVAQMLEIDRGLIRDAMAGFKGVKRRFEYLVKNDRVVYVDDYAHHPEELDALIRSAKRLFPDMKCVVAFQPHLFSRTRDLAEGFAHSLDMADEVILLDIYPAREHPIEGVTSRMIADKMNNASHTIMSKEALLDFVKAAPLQLFITAGAGDIDKLVAPIKEILESK